MNRLLEAGEISEMKCGANFAYVLENRMALMATAYKVLQAQTNSCFVRCMRMTIDGKVQLLYLTEELRPLTALLQFLTPEGFTAVVTNLISDVMDVKNNGFLACRNIDISPEHIFVEPATRRVSLVYLPTDKNLFEDENAFENALRSEMIRLIRENKTLVSPGTIQLTQMLSDGTMGFAELDRRLKENAGMVAETDTAHSNPDGSGEPDSLKTQQHPGGDDADPPADDGCDPTRLLEDIGQLQLVSQNMSVRMKIRITKDSFVIGKNETMSDGAIPFNNMISRVHCRINRTMEGYTITDLDSTNGTFLNKKRISPMRAYPVADGDMISLANSVFQAQIR